VDEPIFHESWEAVAFRLLMNSAPDLNVFNADEYRHAIERMAPIHYLPARYYERVLTGVTTLLVEKGVLDLSDLEARERTWAPAWPVLGLPPDWYKSPEYRARVVREPRRVLKEMGLELDPETRVRVWDTTAETRFVVLPLQPETTQGWSEDQLAEIVTRESMIGVALVASPG